MSNEKALTKPQRKTRSKGLEYSTPALTVGLKLTDKLRRFVDAYLGECWLNATAAARKAGYQGSPSTLAAVGYENLRKPQIREMIDSHLEVLAMPRNEVLARLSDYARSDMGDFIAVDEDGNPSLDLVGAKMRGKLHLVREFGYDTQGRPTAKLYDAQAALFQLAKAYGMFSEKPAEPPAQPPIVYAGLDLGDQRMSVIERLTTLLEEALDEVDRKKALGEWMEDGEVISSNPVLPAAAES